MKNSWILHTLLFLSPLLPRAQPAKPVLVLYQIEMGAIDNVATRERIYNGVNGAFIACCQDYSVRRNHEWRRDGLADTDVLLMDKEVRDILTDIFIRNQHGAEDLERLADFRKQMRTDVVVLGQLLYDPNSQDKAYELILHVLDFATLNYAIPNSSVYLAATEIMDTELIRNKVLIYLQQARFCLREEAENDLPTHDKLVQEIDLIIQMEFLLPQDQEIQRATDRLREDERTYLLYLSRKALNLYESLINQLEAEQTRLDLIEQLLTILQTTYRELYAIDETNRPTYGRLLIQLENMAASFREIRP